MNCDIIVGLDLLKKFYQSIDLLRNVITFRRDLHPDHCTAPALHSGEVFLSVAKSTTLAGSSRTFIHVQFDKSLLADNPGCVIVCEPHPVFASHHRDPVPIQFDATVNDSSSAANGRYQLLVSNPSPYPISLARNFVIGFASVVTTAPLDTVAALRRAARDSSPSPMTDTEQHHAPSSSDSE